jgi:hypothetical protein
MAIHESIISFRAGDDRNEPYARSHTYAETADGLFPMCGYGWNRSNGESFSIFRSSLGTEGHCKLCRKNLSDGKAPVEQGFPHKTKWL